MSHTIAVGEFTAHEVMPLLSTEAAAQLAAISAGGRHLLADLWDVIPQWLRGEINDAVEREWGG